jgi:hypothetical protein
MCLRRAPEIYITGAALDGAEVMNRSPSQAFRWSVCNLIQGCQRFEGLHSPSFQYRNDFYPEDGGRKFLRNVDNYQQTPNPANQKTIILINTDNTQRSAASVSLAIGTRNIWAFKKQNTSSSVLQWLYVATLLLWYGRCPNDSPCASKSC